MVLPKLTSDQQRALDEALRRIDACVAQLPAQDASGNSPADPLWLQGIQPDARTISILGQRGTGKTSVMLAVANSPASNQAAGGRPVHVLPVLDATIAGKEDSIRYFIVHLLEHAVERYSPDGAKQVAKRGQKARAADLALESKKAKALCAVRDLFSPMVGMDPDWRKATAQLSAAQHDFGRWSEMRVDATVGFASKLRTAVKEICTLWGVKALLLPIDDVDLAPQRFLEVAGVLNELRYCPELIVLLAADLADAHLRIYVDLIPAGTGGGDWLGPVRLGELEQMAGRILGKLLPEKYRSYLHVLHPTRRTRVPLGPDEFNDGKVHVHSIGRLLQMLGVATDASAFPTGMRTTDRFEPIVGYLLPGDLRALSDMQTELEAVVAEYVAVQGRVAEHDFPRLGSPEFWAREEIAEGWLIPSTTKGLSILARFAGATDWANDLDMMSFTILRTGGYSEQILLAANFDWTAKVSTGNAAGQGLVGGLNRAVRQGQTIDSWLPLNPFGFLANTAGSKPREVAIGAFGSVCTDVFLRLEPAARLALLRNFGFSDAILGRQHGTAVDASGNNASTFHLSWDMRSVLSVLDDELRKRQLNNLAVPLAASWADMLELLDELENAPQLAVSYGPESVRSIFMQHTALLGIAEIADARKMVAVWLQLYRLCAAREAIAAKRLRESHSPYLGLDLSSPGAPTWLSEVLSALVSPTTPVNDGVPRPIHADDVYPVWRNWDRTEARSTGKNRDSIQIPGTSVTLALTESFDFKVSSASGGLIVDAAGEPANLISATLAWNSTQVRAAIFEALPRTAIFSPKHWAEWVPVLQAEERKLQDKAK